MPPLAINKMPAVDCWNLCTDARISRQIDWGWSMSLKGEGKREKTRGLTPLVFEIFEFLQYRMIELTMGEGYASVRAWDSTVWLFTTRVSPYALCSPLNDSYHIFSGPQDKHVRPGVEPPQLGIHAVAVCFDFCNSVAYGTPCATAFIHP